ncbi:MAG: SDR family NAD(P)-dependent oxidoreductase, partial [Sandaracinaceae bacterium]|nr:SDR family NAD(P)-dependent oxidoreductase [Sandaracinaceae bacterium]
LTVVHGDVALEGLGLSKAHRDALDIDACDHVFHAAALYDLAGDPAVLETVNVGGTRNLLALIDADKFNGTLHFLSSIAVAGLHHGLFTEDMLEKRQLFPTEYHRTKYESERLVRASRVRRRIYRPGAVVGHSETGEMDRIDGAYYLFRAIQAARTTLPRWVTLPRIDLPPVPMVPVDFVADAIDAIAHAGGHDGKCFHVLDAQPPKFRETFNLIADAADAPRMGRARLSKLADFIPGGKNVIGQLGMVRFFRKEVLEDLGIPPVVHEVMSAETQFDTTNFMAALEGTGLRCPPQEEYVEALWDYYRRHLDPSADPEAVFRKALANKIVVITGASSGIGEALARHAGSLGATVALIARRAEELERVSAAIGIDKSSCHPADLTDLEACDRVIADVIARHGRIDVLVNNAGIT